MAQYTQNELLKIAKRYQNAKRSYLLVNPLQAKHIPVSPRKSLDMMEELGRQIADKYGDARLVIGFAETATAIGAVVAGCLSRDCVYVQTTREKFSAAEQWFRFEEEHSHAVEQKLCRENFDAWLDQTNTVILVDDEISTGKTLINMVDQIKAMNPKFAEKTIVAASILNRVTPENEEKLVHAGIASEFLLKLPQDDYEAAVAGFEVCEGMPVNPMELAFHRDELPGKAKADPRIGVKMGEYIHECTDLADAVMKFVPEKELNGKNVLVLGTEEYMFPALLLGRMLEGRMTGGSVKCHATTRSPIGICHSPAYPIQSGCKVKSFYDDARTTYIYDIGQYDTIIVCSDTPVDGVEALRSLAAVLHVNANTKLFYIQGGKHVWYL